MHDDLTARQHHYRTQSLLPSFTCGRGPRPWPQVPCTDCLPQLPGLCRRTLPDKHFTRILTEYRATHATTCRRWEESADPATASNV